MDNNTTYTDETSSSSHVEVKQAQGILFLFLYVKPFIQCYFILNKVNADLGERNEYQVNQPDPFGHTHGVLGDHGRRNK